MLGNGVPLLVALWAVPTLIHGLGAARFGLLTIIWMGIGYLNLFDLGTGRALTKLVAERLGDGRDAELPSLIGTGLKLMFALGCIAAIIAAGITPWVTEDLLRIPPHLVHQSTWSFWILAASLPFVISTSGLVGVLQAHQRFSAVAAVRIPMGILTFLGPVIVLAFTPSLIAITLVLAICRMLAWLAYGWLSRSIRLGSGEIFVPARQAVRELLGFGSWVTISNIVGPVMIYFDRFVIGVLLTMTAVAYYTTPFDVVTRFTIISGALISVIFPALTAALVGDPKRGDVIFLSTARVLLVAMFIPLALAVLFAPEALKFWLNASFARAGAPVVRWLCIGILINSAASLPYAVLEGKGRPDLTGKLHLAELPFYVLMVWILVKDYGIQGAAVAWSVRAAVDGAALFVLGIRYVPELRQAQVRAIFLTTAAACFLSVLVLIHAMWFKAAVSVGIVVVAGGWLLKTIWQVYGQGGFVEQQVVTSPMHH